VLYDIRKHEMKIPGNLSRDDRLETFPAFSPDGSTLYYCSADTHRLPAKYREMKYSLYAVSFDQATGESGTVPDTVIKASVAARSISIPRVSPNGRFLMFNVADYGAFPSYNPEADIWMMDLRSRKIYPLDSLNSSDVESYHSWSSNGRWVAFSSRRNDKLYSNIYLAYIDSNGIARKPFLLPQKDPEFYNKFLYSFNVPEFAVKPVGIGPYQLEKAARSRNFIQIQTGSSH
jgi:Tol biopolymer transport system component